MFVYNSAAQRELVALAQLAEIKGKKVSQTQEGTVDLDQMFTFLAEAPKEVKGEADYLATLNQELDAMFRESQVSKWNTSNPDRPVLTSTWTDWKLSEKLNLPSFAESAEISSWSWTNCLRL